MTTLEWKLEFRFMNRNLLNRALTHKSFHNENKTTSVGNNERLEFLGDSVLSLVLSEQLMRQYPEAPEGHLSKARASLVNEQVLTEVALELEVNEMLRLGKGELTSGGNEKPRLLASAVEAVLGAIFIDSGFEAAKRVILNLFEDRLSRVDLEEQYQQDYKTRLQEIIQERFKSTPIYEVISENGPDHNKEFRVEVKLQDEVLATGLGLSKKQASQEAARLALEGL
jgi:ribonuclease-3